MGSRRSAGKKGAHARQSARQRQPRQGARRPSRQPQSSCGVVSERAGACARRGASSARGSNESRSALLSRPRDCSRRKNTTKVKTRQRLIVRVRGTTAMVVGWVSIYYRPAAARGLRRGCRGLCISCGWAKLVGQEMRRLRQPSRSRCGGFRAHCGHAGITRARPMRPASRDSRALGSFAAHRTREHSARESLGTRADARLDAR